MRLFFNILCIALVLSAPYWIYLPVLLLGIIFFPLYLESILWALLVDVVYGGPSHFKALLGFPFGAAAALLLIFVAPLREHIRFNA